MPGYLVFGTGQPTKIGFENALKFIFTESGAKEVLWTNMRQVFLGFNQSDRNPLFFPGASSLPQWTILHSSSPWTVGAKKIFHLMKILKRMNENMEFPGASGEDIEWLQDGFVTAIKVLSSGIEMTAW